MAPPLPAFERTTQELLEMAGNMQSNLQVPASQPFSDAFRHRAIQMRRRPSVVQHPRNTYLDIGASQVATRENYRVLRDQVLSEVKARLAEADIRIEDMSPLLFSFLLPVRVLPRPLGTIAFAVYHRTLLTNSTGNGCEYQCLEYSHQSTNIAVARHAS